MNWDTKGRAYGTDKSSDYHGYLNYYEAALHNRHISSVLEIGIAFGDSLRLWADLWPNANICGVDINPDCLATADTHITVTIGDATKSETFDWFTPTVWDFIVDDGSHQLQDQLETLEHLAARLTDNGIYVVEDIPWSDTTRGGHDLLMEWLKVLAVYELRPTSVAISKMRTHVAVIAEQA